MKADARRGVDAETQFRVLQTGVETALVEARPLTGRRHQIRVHLAESGHPVVGDILYGRQKEPPLHDSLALRAIVLSYGDPFQKRTVRIEAPVAGFCRSFGWAWKVE